jgi:hypothetical protein
MSRSTRLHGGELTTSLINIEVKKKTSGDMRALNADRFIKEGPKGLPHISTVSASLRETGESATRVAATATGTETNYNNDKGMYQASMVLPGGSLVCGGCGAKQTLEAGRIDSSGGA